MDKLDLVKEQAEYGWIMCSVQEMRHRSSTVSSHLVEPIPACMPKMQELDAHLVYIIIIVYFSQEVLSVGTVYRSKQKLISLHKPVYQSICFKNVN